MHVSNIILEKFFNLEIHFLKDFINFLITQIEIDTHRKKDSLNETPENKLTLIFRVRFKNIFL